MLFIGIFGILDKEKFIKEFNNVICQSCERLTRAALREHYTYFHIFFIPIFRWSRQYFVKLRCCGAVYEADAAYAKELRISESIDFSRLKKVSSGFSGFEDAGVLCANCGKRADGGFAYCPFCGTKL